MNGSILYFKVICRVCILWEHTLVELAVLLENLLDVHSGPWLIGVQALHELIEACQSLAARLAHLVTESSSV